LFAASQRRRRRGRQPNMSWCELAIITVAGIQTYDARKGVDDLRLNFFKGGL